MNDRHIPLLAEEGWMRRAKRRRRRGGQIGEMFLRTDHPGASIGASPYRARASRHPSQGSRTISPLFSFGRLPYCYGAGQQGSSGYSSARRGMRFILLLVLALALQGCRDNRDSQQQPPAPHHPAILSPSAPAATARLMDGMGKVDFPITTSSKDAQ